MFSGSSGVTAPMMEIEVSLTYSRSDLGAVRNFRGEDPKKIMLAFSAN